MLMVCGPLLLLTFLFVRFSFVYLALSTAVGLLDAVISVDELTGGKMLSWLSLPLLMAGQIIAAYIAGLNADSFGLIIQFFLVVCCVELIIVMVFRARIERFVTAKR
jgi:hypothetical protein